MTGRLRSRRIPADAPANTMARPLASRQVRQEPGRCHSDGAERPRIIRVGPSSLTVLRIPLRGTRLRRAVDPGDLCQPSGPDGEGQARGRAREARGETSAAIRRTGDESRETLDPASSCLDDHRMRFPWQPQEYTRTCAQCGSTWQVPRWARRRRSKLVNMFLSAFAVVAELVVDTDPADIARTAGSISEQNRMAEVYRHCPKCHADHFTQSTSRGELPY